MSSRQYSEDCHSSGCSYASLTNYNASHKMGVPRPSQVTGSYMVPVYGTAGYDTLSHGSKAPSCSGYFHINNAYKSDCTTQFVRKLCQ
jgi:hypothetical protein